MEQVLRTEFGIAGERLEPLSGGRVNRLWRRGSLGLREAAHLGAMLGRLHVALRTTSWECPPPPGPPQPQVAVTRWEELKQRAMAVEVPTEFEGLVAAMAEHVAEVLPRLQGVAGEGQDWQVCHGDLHLDNLLFDEAGNVTGILDFDNAGPSWAWVELMMAWNLCFCVDPGEARLTPEAVAFFAAYRHVTGLSGEALAALPHRYWHTLVATTWPAPLRYREGSVYKPEWAEILQLRLRAARWPSQNGAAMGEWLTACR